MGWLDGYYYCLATSIQSPRAHEIKRNHRETEIARASGEEKLWKLCEILNGNDGRVEQEGLRKGMACKY
jgi:hypothetical protein